MTYPLFVVTAALLAASASADPFEVVEISPGAIGLHLDLEDGSTVDRDGTEDAVAERHEIAKRSPKILGETAIFKKLGRNSIHSKMSNNLHKYVHENDHKKCSPNFMLGPEILLPIGCVNMR